MDASNSPAPVVQTSVVQKPPPNPTSTPLDLNAVVNGAKAGGG
ncbi:hypothetical protein [Streptomyces sp. NPDC005046]